MIYIVHLFFVWQENSERARANLLVEVFKLSSNYGYISEELQEVCSGYSLGGLG